MLYFAYLPKTTIADIIPVLVASFDSNFVKPCTPKVANDGTLYYDKHERYVIEHSSHPLKFRSINWSSKKEVLSKFAQKNTFVGNYQDHTNILKDLPHKTITVTYNSGYSPLIYKQVEMFNKHHPAEFAIKQLDIVCNYDQPKADVSIDLVDLYNKAKLVEFMDTLGVTNQAKIDFIDFWLEKLYKNQEYMKILIDNS